MLTTTVSQGDIDAFVNKVIRWSQTLLKCADVAVQKAHDQFQAGDIELADFNAVLQNKIAVTQKCFEMTNSASTALTKIVASQLGPLQDATARLTEAAKTLDKITNAVIIISELVVAAGALATAIAVPGLASIAAAGSAVFTVAQQIESDATS
jgi:hypothetical protein